MKPFYSHNCSLWGVLRALSKISRWTNRQETAKTNLSPIYVTGSEAQCFTFGHIHSLLIVKIASSNFLYLYSTWWVLTLPVTGINGYLLLSCDKAYSLTTLIHVMLLKTGNQDHFLSSTQFVTRALHYLLTQTTAVSNEAIHVWNRAEGRVVLHLID